MVIIQSVNSVAKEGQIVFENIIRDFFLRKKGKLYELSKVAEQQQEENDGESSQLGVLAL